MNKVLRKSQEKCQKSVSNFQKFVFLLAAVMSTVFRVCCFQQLSLIVVGTGFLFSFVFHWGTVEPASSAGTRREEQEQGKLVKIKSKSI